MKTENLIPFILIKRVLAAAALLCSLSSYAESSAMSEAEVKCFEITKRVCGTGEDATTCMKNNPSAFPSYCANEVGSKLRDVKSATNSTEMGTCFEAMKTKCVLKTGEDETDVKVLQAAVAKYQKCVMDNFSKTKACGSLVDKEN